METSHDHVGESTSYARSTISISGERRPGSTSAPARDEGRELVTRSQPQLAVDVGELVGDGPFGHAAAPCDLFHRATGHDALGDLDLGGCQLGQTRGARERVTEDDVVPPSVSQ